MQQFPEAKQKRLPHCAFPFKIEEFCLGIRITYMHLYFRLPLMGHFVLHVYPPITAKEQQFSRPIFTLKTSDKILDIDIYFISISIYCIQNQEILEPPKNTFYFAIISFHIASEKLHSTCITEE